METPDSPPPRSREWLVYVRWANGKRETTKTHFPDEVATSDRLWVLACVPVPTITVMEGKPR